MNDRFNPDEFETRPPQVIAADLGPIRSILLRAAVAFMAVILAMFAGFGWYFQGQQNEIEATATNLAAEVARNEADRAQARETSCAERVRDRMALNQALLQAAGFDRETGQPTEPFLAADPERQERARSFLVNLRPLPICTADEIAAYYSSDGQQGVVPIDGSDNDYAEAVTEP